MICIIVSGSLILVELPTEWMPIRNEYQNTVSEGFTLVLGHVMLNQLRRGTSKLLWNTPQDTLLPVVLEFSSLKKRVSKWCGFHVMFCLLATQFSVH